MSTLHLRTMLRNLVLLIGLGLTATARAEHVDWSQYLEPPGAKPMPVRTTQAPAAAPAKKQVSRASATKAKPAAKKKPAAARKPHR